MSRVVSTSKLAPDWLQKNEQPLRSQVSMQVDLTPDSDYNSQVSIAGRSRDVFLREERVRGVTGPVKKN